MSDQREAVAKQVFDEAKSAAKEVGGGSDNLSAVINYLCDLCASARLQLAEVERERHKAMLALESLTPSGSEFVGDVERCVAFVRQSNDSQHRAMVTWAKRAHAAERENAGLRERVVEAIAPWLRHDSACAYWRKKPAHYDDTWKLEDCTCGLARALSPPVVAATEET